MDDKWVGHRSGFVCGNVGIYPVDDGIWVVWERVDGVWVQATPYTAAGPQSETLHRQGPPMFEIPKRTANETIEAAKWLALKLRASRLN